MIAPARNIEPKLVWDEETTARACCVSAKTVKRWRESGALKCVRIGAGKRQIIRYRPADVSDFLDAQCSAQHNNDAGTTKNLAENGKFASYTETTETKKPRPTK